MASVLYRIRDWDSLYENAETRKLESLRWVLVPNKHDGLGFRRLAQQRNRTDLFTAWVLMIQIASKGRKGQRGTLDRDGRALDAEDMSLMTGFPAQIFEQALSFFSEPKQGWLLAEPVRDASATPASASEQSGGSPGCPASSPGQPGDSPGSPGSPPAEGKEGIEEKGKKEGGAGALIIPLLLNVPEFLGPWSQWVSIRRKGKKPKTDWDTYLLGQLEWLETLGLQAAIECVTYSARNQYQGLFEPKANGGNRPHQQTMR